MKQFLDQDGVQYLWNKVRQNFANLSNNGKVPANQLPSYVDDVLEYGTFNTFPTTGEDGKIYVAQDTNLTYRWSGTRYVEISQSLALGETSTTAYPGDKGKQLSEDLKAEIGRAKHEEADIRAALVAEQNRAEVAEKNNRSLIQKNASDITIETNNRISGDEALSVSINTEKTARQDADDKEKLARKEADDKEKAERQNQDNLIKAKIEQEQTRAQNAEKLITNNLNSEISRAKAAEQQEAKSRSDADDTIKVLLNTEVSRAKSEEESIRNSVTAEKNRAESSESELRTLIDKNSSDIVKEQKARQTADNTLTANLATEKQARIDADDTIKSLLNTEISRAKSEESKLTTSITAEVSRATTAESDLSDRITAEKNRATTAESTITNNLNTEISDRKEAIKAESDRAKAAEQAMQENLGSITIAKVASDDATIAASYQLQVNGEAKGTTINIAKDQSIKDINVLDMNATLKADGTIQAGSPVGSTALCISYILADGTYKLAKLDYSRFLEETEFSNGLEVKDHKIYVKVDPSSESFLSVSSAGVKITGVQNAINTAVDAERVAREAECKQIKDSITQSGQGSTVALDNEIKRAKEAEAAITSNLNNHIQDYQNPHKVTKDQVGLSNVDNTSDADKPVSDATQTELDKKANQTYVNQLQQTITNMQTTIQQLQTKVNNMSTTIESVQNNITNMQTTINTLPTVDNNDAKYLRKDKDDSTPYTITAKALYKAQL